jgi:hypothetical protein
MRTLLLALVFSVMFCASGFAVAQPYQSAYTKHDYEKCRLIADEEPVTERQCEGHGGILVNWTNEPDASFVAFGKEGLVGEAGKAFTFAVAGETVEWRGAMAGGKLVPFAAIVRFDLCGGIGGPCHPELVLFRLDGAERSCIAATVDARKAKANERARQLADGFVRTFRCGKDKRRTG